MRAQYHIVRAVFWHAEGKLQDRIETPEDRRTVYLPLPEGDPLRKEYLRVAIAVDLYLKIADENKLTVSPAMIYLGGLAKYSLGDNSGAPVLLERLNEFPDYRRSRYEGEDPHWGVPAAPAISKLLFYCRLQTALKKADSGDTFGQLKQITADALRSLQLQREFAALVASQTDQYNRYEFDEASFGGGLFNGQPCQARAGALPSTLQLVDEAWTKLLESALKKSGAQAMRDWLRGLSTPDAPLSELALYHLQNIDALIIKQLFADAQQQMNAHNYDGARAKYKQLIADYPGTDAAQKAQDALPQIVPVAVNYYKSEGDKYYQPVNHIGVPQSKAKEFYNKMLSEDPQGAQADYAMLQFSQTLGTEGKVREAIQTLKNLLEKFPASKHRASATYLIGFFYGGMSLKQYDQSIQWMQKVVAEFPGAPESLWHIAFILGSQKHQAEAIPFLEQLKQKYPNSFRHRWVDEEISNLKNQM